MKALPKVDERHPYEMGFAELRQVVAESRNTIFQLRKKADLFKRQQREGWQGKRRGQEQQPTKHQGPKKGVTVPEGSGKGVKQQPSSPQKVQTRMMRTS